MTEAWRQFEGRVIDGQFQLHRYLGCGLQSGVFLTAYGEEEAAIKLVAADPTDVRWDLATGLSHPHLLRIFRTGNCRVGDRELLYIVMEYAPENLAEVLAGRALTEDEAREMRDAVLETLQYLHERGLVHGCIKPSNILAAGDRLKIPVDGLYRAGEPRRAGNPGVYDAPETAQGGMSPAADLWSLGVTLAEALTQRLPVGGVPPEGLPAAFADTVRQYLDMDPRRRSVAGITGRPRPGRRYLLPAIASAAALAAVIAAPKLLQRPVPSPPAQRQQPELTASTKPAEHSADRVVRDKEDSSVAPVPKAAPVRKGPQRVVRRVMPDVPPKARDTIQGTVRVGVRVRVDPSGRVVNAKLDGPGPSRYFAGLTLEAARRWRFEPLNAPGQGESTEWILKFEHTKTGTVAVPVQVKRP